MFVNSGMADARQDWPARIKSMIAATQVTSPPGGHVMNVAKFERFFRVAAGLDVDKEDLKRYSDFVQHKLYDLLLRGDAIAKANNRVVIEPYDLPITKGLQESVHQFEEMDEEIDLRPILDHLAIEPPLGRGYSEDVENYLPLVIGGLSVALARTFKIIDGTLKNPSSEHWEKCFRIFGQLL
jgi:hypothetical protein